MRVVSGMVVGVITGWSALIVVAPQALSAMTPTGQEADESVRGESTRIVSRAISIGQTSSSLRLELSDGSRLEILGSSDGDWHLNGAVVGRTASGDPFHRSWATQLMPMTAEASAPELFDLLSSWQPSEEMSAEAATVLRNLRIALANTPLGRLAESGSDLQDTRQPQAAGTVERESDGRSLAPEVGAVSRQRPSRGRGPVTSSLHAVGTGVGNVLEASAAIIALTLLGLAAQALVPRRIQLVSEVARGLPTRAGLVGFMSSMLFLPAWLLGSVALAISVVGILAVPVWLIGFPIAAAGAAIVGSLAVARNLGEWLAESGYPLTDRLRASNYLHTGFAGIVFLALGPTAASILSLVPGFGLLAILAGVIGWVAISLAACVGIGAVVLTKGGSHHPPSWHHLGPDWSFTEDNGTEVIDGPTGSTRTRTRHVRQRGDR